MYYVKYCIYKKARKSRFKSKIKKLLASKFVIKILQTIYVVKINCLVKIYTLDEGGKTEKVTKE